MKRRTKMDTKDLDHFEVVAGRQGGQGIFAIEDAAEEIARRTKLTYIAEQIVRYDRGSAGNRRRCPQCGQWQQYKGERTREVGFDCGTVTVVRAYYVCPGCGATGCSVRRAIGVGRGERARAVAREVGVTGSGRTVSSSPASMPDTVGE